ncbi:uncharacterized protein [Miscanthus floridulus]|uniref:uncharacterized protein n=1 Tax=Miscanthus floridulus TaxID=154761 RepID=UPI003458D1EF
MPHPAAQSTRRSTSCIWIRLARLRAKVHRLALAIGRESSCSQSLQGRPTRSGGASAGLHRRQRRSARHESAAAGELSRRHASAAAWACELSLRHARAEARKQSSSPARAAQASSHGGSGERSCACELSWRRGPARLGRAWRRRRAPWRRGPRQRARSRCGSGERGCACELSLRHAIAGAWASAEAREQSSSPARASVGELPWRLRRAQLRVRALVAAQASSVAARTRAARESAAGAGS